MRRVGKKALEWQRVRKQWFIDHPQDYYTCHYCKRSMEARNTTLDHKENRNHDDANRGENLVPCCYWDNSRKGSVSYERYLAKYYPDMLD